jgi:hypothetical protein
VDKLNRCGADVDFKGLVRVECEPSHVSYRLNQNALRRLARRLKLPVARTQLRARAAWRTAITQDVPLIVVEESEGGTREAQEDVHRLARELWPKVKFPHPDQIRIRRRATLLVDRRAA